MSFDLLPTELVEKILFRVLLVAEKPWGIRRLSRVCDAVVSEFLKQKQLTISAILRVMGDGRMRCEQSGKAEELEFCFIPAFAKLKLSIDAEKTLTEENITEIRGILLDAQPGDVESLELRMNNADFGSAFPKQALRKLFSHPKLKSLMSVAISSKCAESKFLKFFTGLIYRKQSIKEIKLVFDDCEPPKRQIGKLCRSLAFNVENNAHCRRYTTITNGFPSGYQVDGADLVFRALMASKRSVTLSVDFLDRFMATALFEERLHTFRTNTQACYPIYPAPGVFPRAILCRSTRGLFAMETMEDSRTLKVVCVMCFDMFGNGQLQCIYARWKEANVVRVHLACDRAVDDSSIGALEVEWKQNLENLFTKYILKTKVAFEVAITERKVLKTAESVRLRLKYFRLEHDQMHIPFIPPHLFHLFLPSRNV